MRLEELDNKLNEFTDDEQTRNWKWKKPSKMNRLEKKSIKKADHVLVEYLTQKNGVRRMLVKVVAGNLAVIDNKVHRLNPRELWKDGNHFWYKIREIDRLPISNRDYDKLIQQGRLTIDDSVVIKAILGAVQKKELAASTKKWILWLVLAAAAGVVIYIFFIAK